MILRYYGSRMFKEYTVLTRRHIYQLKSTTRFNDAKNDVNKKVCKQTIRNVNTTPKHYKNELQDRKLFFGLINPFKHIAMKFKLYSISRLDPEFNVKQFEEGAKQAMHFVSSHISKGNISALKEVLTPEGVKCGQHAFEEHSGHTDVLVVNEFHSFALADIQIKSKNDQFWVFILVINLWIHGVDIKTTSFTTATSENPMVMLKCLFCREFTPDSNSSWLIDKIDYVVVPK